MSVIARLHRGPWFTRSGDERSFDTITAAVGSPYAKRIRDKGECRAQAIRLQGLDKEPLGELILTIKLP